MGRLMRVSLIWGLLFGPMLAYLATRQPPIFSRALTPDSVSAPAIPVPVTPGERPLWRMGPGDLSGADRIALLVATWGTEPRITAAHLRVGTCVFALAAPRAVGDGTLLPLDRTAPCVDTSSASALLSIDASGGRLALWAWQRPGDGRFPHQGLSLTDPAGGQTALSFLRGRVEYPWTTHTPRRASIALWWWATTGWPVLWIVVGALAVGLGGLHTLLSGRPSTGAALLSASLAIIWALVVPPLQGADDPDHLLSLAEVTDRPAVAAALPDAARLLHFERIRFHTNERYATPDTRTPYPIAWTGDVHAERMESRSPLAIRLWRLAGLVLPTESPVALLLGLRLMNACLFAVVVGLSVRLVVWAGAPSPWALVGATLMPALPSFAGMTSDWSYIVPWAVLIGASLLVLMRGRGRAPWAGFGLGVGGALLVSTSLGAWPAMPLLAVSAVGFLVLRGSQVQRSAFWAGLGAGGVVALWLLGDLIATGYQRYDAVHRESFTWLLTLVNRTLAQVAESPWMLLAVPLALAAVDPLLTRLRTSSAAEHVVRRAGIAAATAVAAAAVATAVASVLVPLPTLATIDPTGRAPVPAATYIWQSLAALATPFRLTGFDFLTFTSLWSGFGWIDATLPSGVLAGIALLLMALVIAPAWWLRRVSADGAGWFLVLLVGATASAVAYATAAALMQRNLHGRYLLPLVVPLVIAYGRPLGDWIAADARRAWSAAALLALLHGASLWWVVHRYV